MEDINDDKSILNGLKAHFKEFSPEIIETLYQENNKDITKTRDALIENLKLLNLYDKENKKMKMKILKKTMKIARKKKKKIMIMEIKQKMKIMKQKKQIIKWMIIY